MKHFFIHGEFIFVDLLFQWEKIGNEFLVKIMDGLRFQNEVNHSL
jgi:hypothetical protein